MFPTPDPSPDWIAAAVVLWLGAAGWVTAVASHLRLPEWRWFLFAMLTGPVAWVVVALRLGRERRRRMDARAADPAPPVATGAGEGSG